MYKGRDRYAVVTLPGHCVDGGTGWVRKASRWMFYQPQDRKQKAMQDYVGRNWPR